MSCFSKNNFSRRHEYGILTVDIGSSGCRAILFDNIGTIISRAEKSYSCLFDEANGYAEQNPDAIFESFIQVAHKCIPQSGLSLKYIVLGSVLHSLVLLDSRGAPLTPLTIWADTRAKAQCRKLKELYLQKGWYQKTGCLLSPSYPVFRLLWYKENRPELYKKFFRAASIKSYILFRLFGCYIEDHALASGTGMFNIFTKDWEEEIIDFLELRRNRLPETVPVEHQLSGRSSRKISHFEFPPDAKLIVGSADGPLAHLGSAYYSHDIASLTMGTSGSVRVLSKKQWICPDSSLWCYVLDNKSFISGISTNNCGNVVDWYVKTFLPEKTNWRELGERLKSAVFDPDFFFLPFIFEERYKQNIFACLFGVRHNHSANDFLRVVMEGVIFNMIHLLERLASLREIKKVVISGGVIRSPFVKGLLSTIINVPVIRGGEINASLKGALLLVPEKDLCLKEKTWLKRSHIPKKKAISEKSNYIVELKNSPMSEKYFKWKQLCGH